MLPGRDALPGGRSPAFACDAVSALFVPGALSNWMTSGSMSVTIGMGWVSAMLASSPALAPAK
jgi:hypothetical protein